MATWPADAAINCNRLTSKYVNQRYKQLFIGCRGINNPGSRQRNVQSVLSARLVPNGGGGLEGEEPDPLGSVVPQLDYGEG